MGERVDIRVHQLPNSREADGRRIATGAQALVPILIPHVRIAIPGPGDNEQLPLILPNQLPARIRLSEAHINHILPRRLPDRLLRRGRHLTDPAKLNDRDTLEIQLPQALRERLDVPPILRRMQPPHAQPQPDNVHDRIPPGRPRPRLRLQQQQVERHAQARLVHLLVEVAKHVALVAARVEVDAGQQPLLDDAAHARIHAAVGGAAGPLRAADDGAVVLGVALEAGADEADHDAAVLVRDAGVRGDAVVRAVAAVDEEGRAGRGEQRGQHDLVVGQVGVEREVCVQVLGVRADAVPFGVLRADPAVVAEARSVVALDEAEGAFFDHACRELRPGHGVVEVLFVVGAVGALVLEEDVEEERHAWVQDDAGGEGVLLDLRWREVLDAVGREGEYAFEF